ncbi:hypothetical protein JAAARDRAFT_197899 [Jaapia argillacea MUCL 33604]|uniref:F-box domain-containing protein n=1 Tax=Jaapia argillacea MUCL 33604 TaxID=933084 RepID=A0A067PG43_9AGAM|nr:hypothetical protein JAAARDRAFT_197899 [Jaapia argillacea MUCL 33604]
MFQVTQVGGDVVSAAPLKLPLELIYLIFHFALIPYKTDAAFSISLVSSRARHFSLPYIFSTLAIRTAPNKSPPIPLHLATHVRNIWIETVADLDALTIFERCGNATNIALPGSLLQDLQLSVQHRLEDDPTPHSDCGRLLPCRSLFIIGLPSHSFAPIISSPYGRSFFANITHLAVRHSIDEDETIPHECLPNLTHMAFILDFHSLYWLGRLLLDAVERTLARDGVEKVLFLLVPPHSHHTFAVRIFRAVRKARHHWRGWDRVGVTGRPISLYPAWSKDVDDGVSMWD